MSAADDYARKASEAAQRLADNVRAAAGKRCYACGAPHVNGYLSIDGELRWLCWSCIQGRLEIDRDVARRRNTDHS